jgi:nicotinamide phosphoribosyltransferase
MKATYVELTQTVGEAGIGETGAMDKQITVGRELFKDPITDDGTKKSATGLLSVYDNYEGGLTLIDKASWESESQGRLKTIYKDGEFQNATTLTEIRNRLK